MSSKPFLISALVIAGISYGFFRAAPELQRFRAASTAASAPFSAQPKYDAITTYRELLADTDRRVEALEKLRKNRPDDWVSREHLASVLLERAALTGRSSDYVRVQDVLNEAFKIAPSGSGPVLTAARFHYSIHQLNKSEEYLNILDKQAIVTPAKRLAAAALRANIAFHRGDYVSSLKTYEECEAAAPGFCRSDLAVYRSQTSDFTGAEALYNQAFADTHAKDVRTQAWLKLHLAIASLEQGKYDQALARLKEADAILPGWWLVREHMAEVLALQGKLDEAIALYTEIIDETDLPQFMDALAGCYLQQGNTTAAESLIKRAETRWDEELKLLPESAGGHALEHYLEFSSDPAKLIELAERNKQTRPGGEAKLYLARGYLKVGRVKDARTEVDSVLSTRYNAADLYDVAAQVYKALGENKNAEEFHRRCRELNPQCESP